MFTNPGFRFAQLYNPSAAFATFQSGGVTLDAWKAYFEGLAGGLSAERKSNAASSWTSAYRGQFKKLTDNGKVMIVQVIENELTKELYNKTISLRFKVLSSATRTMNMVIIKWDGTADTLGSLVSAWNGGGVDPTLGASFTQIYKNSLALTGGVITPVTGVFSPVPNTNNLLIGLYSDTQVLVNDYIDIAEAGLYVGSNSPSLWLPLTPEEDLKRVERFIEKSYDPDTAPGTATASGCVGQTLYWPFFGTSWVPIHFRRSKVKDVVNTTFPGPIFDHFIPYSPGDGSPGNWWRPLPLAGGNIPVNSTLQGGENNITIQFATGNIALQGHYVVNVSL